MELRRELIHLLGIYACLLGEVDQRRFRGIADRIPRHMLLVRRIDLGGGIHEQGIEEMLPRDGECFIDRRMILGVKDIAYRLVAVALDLIGMESEHHAFHRHLVLGQGTGLIGAYHIDASQCLYGRQLLHERLVLGQPSCSQR